MTSFRILFDLSCFYEELPAYFEKADDPQNQIPI
jgi:hypothetical protein